MTSGSIDVFFTPRSVAVIGASEDATRIGGRPLRYLIESGYRGEIYPININRQTVQGIKAYKSIKDIEGPIDCVLVVVPAESVEDAVINSIEAGARGIIVFSSGFAETGAKGSELQEYLLSRAKQANVRILGPNCLGAFDTSAKSYLTFSGVYGDVVGKSGDYAFVSQSGGFAGELIKYTSEYGIHFGKWITTGNECDVEFGEVLSYLADQPDVRVVGAFLEGSRNGASFIKALRKAKDNNKKVVVLKAGRTQAAADAIRSHTAGLAGDDAVYDALFKKYGVYRASSVENMLDVLYALKLQKMVSGNRLCILTSSGGNGALATDCAYENGFVLPPLSAETQQGILALSNHANASNPIDLTAKMANDPSILSRGIDLALSNNCFDCVYIFIGLVAGIPSLQEAIFNELKDLPARYPEIPMALSVTASPEICARYHDAGFIVCRDPTRAIRMLAAIRDLNTEGDSSEHGKTPSREVIAVARNKVFNEVESKDLLRRIGIRCLDELFVRTIEEADEVSKNLGGSYAVKVVSSKLIHKTDAGGVLLNVDSTMIRTATETIADNVRSKAGVEVEGFLLSPMINEAPQFFIGARVDSVFGAVIVVGTGGVFVDLIEDSICNLAPVGHAEAVKMIMSLKGFKLLDGFRGAPKSDVAALANAVVAISEFAKVHEDYLRTIEINPVAVLPEGEGVIALDGVIETT